MEWLKDREPASTRFDRIVTEAQSGAIQLEMTRINYGEVVYSTRKSPDISDRLTALNAFYKLPILVQSIDDALVDEAVELKSKYSFAFADAFAAALAIRLGVPLVTGDPEFRALELDGLLSLQWVGA
jgi:predicted nucleic acid-binding protein